MKIIAFNHNIPFAPIKEEEISITIKGIQHVSSAFIERIDAQNANPMRKWLELGSLEYLNKKMLDELSESSSMKKETVSYASVADAFGAMNFGSYETAWTWLQKL